MNRRVARQLHFRRVLNQRCFGRRVYTCMYVYIRVYMCIESREIRACDFAWRLWFCRRLDVFSVDRLNEHHVPPASGQTYPTTIYHVIAIEMTTMGNVASSERYSVVFFFYVFFFYTYFSHILVNLLR